MREMKNDQLVAFRQSLITWYENNQRDLPWRTNADPYRIWISEVMLQQTQVVTVIPYYIRFIAAFPAIEALAAAPLDTVLKVWEGLGYYARIRNFHHSAKEVVTKHDGKVPRDPESFRALKGVGEYIAAAVLSIAFDQPLPVIDGNVKRVLSRLFRIPQPVNQATALKAFRSQAEQLLAVECPGVFNQAIMELGALVCVPRHPDCKQCPLIEFCEAARNNEVASYPKKAPRKRVPTHHIAVGVVWDGDNVLVTKRKPEGLLGGLYEFPGGKIESGETAEAACIREIKEETGLAVSIRGHLTTVRHAYTHFKIVMEVFVCDRLAGDIVLNGPVAYRWAALDELTSLPFPKANQKFMPMLTRDR